MYWRAVFRATASSASPSCRRLQQAAGTARFRALLVFLSWALVALFLLTFATTAQNPRLSPRDLFLSTEAVSSSANPDERSVATTEPDKGDNRRTIRPLSVRYALLRRQQDGRYVGVSPASTVFRPGDRVRLQVAANQDAYVIVLQRGSSGKWGMLVPHKGDSGHPLSAFDVCDVPGAPSAFGFDERLGEERLVFIVSRADMSARSLVDRLNASELSVRTADPTNDVERKTRDLVFEEVQQDEQAASAGAAVYVAGTDGQGDAPLLVELTLKHGAR